MTSSSCYRQHMLEAGDIDSRPLLFIIPIRGLGAPCPWEERVGIQSRNLCIQVCLLASLGIEG